MGTRCALVLVGLLACTKAPPSPSSPDQQEPPGMKAPPIATPVPPPVPPPSPAVTVQMTAATLGDDCGGGPPAPSMPAPKAKSATKLEKADMANEDIARMSKSKRKCEQTSMQLAIDAPAGVAAAKLTVKKVELYDSAGALVGALTSRAPTVWSDAGTYQTWDENIVPAQQLSVSYALTQPDWSTVQDRWNKTYVLKAVVTVGGAEQTVQRDVQVMAPASLPPGVKT